MTVCKVSCDPMKLSIHGQLYKFDRLIHTSPVRAKRTLGFKWRTPMTNIKFLVALITLILMACGIFSTPMPAPMNSPVPPSTEVFIPPTAALESSPASAPLIFRDDFEGSLDESWQWIREDNEYWSLTNTPGWLEIMARSGSVGAGTVNNVLLRPAPGGNFELETRLKFEPTGNFQIAGLLIYESDDHFIQFGRAFCNVSQCAGDGFYFDLISGGKMFPENFAAAAPATDIVRLVLSREGNVFAAYASEDGGEWTLIGAHTSDMNPVFIGLVAGQAVDAVAMPAQFDSFLVTALP